MNQDVDQVFSHYTDGWALVRRHQVPFSDWRVSRQRYLTYYPRRSCSTRMDYREMMSNVTPGEALPRATMKDVAALAKVSLKTVSRVINNEPSVNEELVARVREAAERLRYQPNQGARTLRRSDGKSGTIAVLLADLANPFSAAMLRAIEEVALARSVSVLSGSVTEDPQRERQLCTAMMSHRVDGVIMEPSGGDHDYLRDEQRAGVPFVFIDRPANELKADFVASNSRSGSYEAVRHLISFGHRRIAYMGDLWVISTARDRRDGYRDALREAGIECDESLEIGDLNDVEKSYQAAKHLLDLPAPPSAIFTGQNLVTIGVVKALKERGLQNVVALVGFDDFPLADLLEPAITVVAQNPREIGRVAATKLFEKIDGASTSVTTEYIPTQLLIRGSGEIRPS